MKLETLHKLVGACVISGTIGLSMFWMGQKSDSDTLDGYRLMASFSKIDGITVGSDVLLAGIPIGSVICEALDPKNHQVTLTMQIKEGVELPYDSVAKVTSDGIFGGKYISVDVGGEYEMLEDGDSFEFIQDSIIFEDIFKKIIEMGESGLARRKEKAAKSDAAEKKSNPFATDPSLLPNFETEADTQMDDPFDDPLDEGEGPL